MCNSIPDMKVLIKDPVQGGEPCVTQDRGTIRAAQLQQL